jgi:signal transduction histidine kinase
MMPSAADDSELQQDIARIAAIDCVPTILDVVCKTTGMGFAAVARVTDTHWVACAVEDQIGFGLKPGGELPLQSTICDEIRCSGQSVVIDHVAEDGYFSNHHTPATYGFQSYISMPIFLPDGSFYGTLCAIDPRPAKLDNPQIRGMFSLFAELLAFHIDSQTKLEVSQAALLDARQAAELRDQFIAVLGHDLRNPLASVDAGARLLRRSPLDDKSRDILILMQKSVTRMAGLVNNLLDFARGSLGDGMSVSPKADPALELALRHVVEELGSAHLDRRIEVEMDLEQPAKVDSDRMCQLLSNLLGNALTHGARDEPVKVFASTADGEFTLAVANGGDAIPPATMTRLFQPFTRSAKRGAPEGLGLGLYISDQIAKAHGGSLGATSTAQETRFTFRMPLDQASAAAE